MNLELIVASWRQIAMALGSYLGILVTALTPWPASNSELFLKIMGATGSWLMAMATYSFMQKPIGAPNGKQPMFSTGEFRKERDAARRG